ncbi:glycosyltransferase family 39 protein [Aneurinibacillus terranovensis]|uniref:glycosyltransferase family 39 protein n=1 Tax=Aneurinibacillus terranovensis TaxID=278991 RepID=UPI00048020D4|nr:glycosyltransferase family 39 protein [Aneurinibacillus terranovensis]
MRFKGRVDFLLVGIIVLSFFLNFYRLKEAGTNSYYTVAVKSMLTNFHAFFYASFDPVGFITVDKPPVALWIQTLSAYLFGFSDFSVLLPEALAGVVSVWLMYVIVKPKFGRKAGLLSSLILACTPIFIAVVRTNNVDSILIVTLLLATWSLMKSVEKQKISWLLLSVLLVGIGFNIKMLQAYMVVPAFYLFYFLASKGKWTKRVLQLTLATVVLASVSLSWATIVDLTPKDQRPYIGSSQTNSVLELAFGYNGISRLTGNRGQGNPPQGMSNTNSKDNKQMQQQAGSGQPPFPGSGNNAKQGQMGPGGTGGGMFGTGTPGVARLFSKELSGQISWLMPFILFAIVGLIVSFRRTRMFTIQHQFAIFWLAWLLPMMVFFSIAVFFHQYYLSMMGPAIAALVGIGWTTLWDLYKEQQGWVIWLLPTSILGTFLFEALILYENKTAVSAVWIGVAGFLGLLMFALLAAMRTRGKIAYYISVAGMITLLIFPAYWGLYTVIHGGNSMTPIAGPDTNKQGMMGRGPGGNPPGAKAPTGMRGPGQMSGGMMGRNVDSKLLSYLEKNYKGEKFILATEDTQSANSIMLNSNYAVMAMGGFQGSDPAVTSQKLAQMTRAGEVKYFLISQRSRGNQNVSDWIQKNCTEIPSSEWQSWQNTDTKQPFDRNGGTKLYMYKG